MPKFANFASISFPVNGKDIYEDAFKKTSILSTGSESLNQLLDGGLWTGEVVEIVGPPGCGKTQTCLSSAASLVADSRGSVFYIDSNGSFVCERLLEIIAQRKGPTTSQFLQEALSNLKYLRIFDAISLLSQLRSIEYKLKYQTEPFYCNLKLIILDSITPVISPILGGGQTQGHMLMMEIGRILKKISLEYNIATIVVNGVVSDRSSDGKLDYKPALGKSWKLVPHSRIQIQPVLNAVETGKSYRAVLTKSNKKETGLAKIFAIAERGVI